MDVKTRSIQEIFNSMILHVQNDETRVYKSEDEELKDLIESNFRSCGASDFQCQKAGFEKFINIGANRRQQELLRVCMDYIQQVIKGSNRVLFLHGNPGTGKTFMALSMLKQFCATEKPMKKFKTWVRDIDECESKYCAEHKACNCEHGCEHGHYREEESGLREFKTGEYIKSDVLCEKILGKEKNLLAQVARKIYANCEFLIIDEVGRPTGFNSKVESEVLFKVLDERKENNLPTVLCSNLSYDELQGLLGKALASRISENGAFFDTAGIEDMRSQQVRNWIQHVRGES